MNGVPAMLSIEKIPSCEMKGWPPCEVKKRTRKQFLQAMYNFCWPKEISQRTHNWFDLYLLQKKSDIIVQLTVLQHPKWTELWIILCINYKSQNSYSGVVVHGKNFSKNSNIIPFITFLTIFKIRQPPFYFLCFSSLF